MATGMERVHAIHCQLCGAHSVIRERGAQQARNQALADGWRLTTQLDTDGRDWICPKHVQPGSYQLVDVFGDPV